MEKIICVGKNYLKHAQELGDAVPTEPMYFIKPPSVLFTADPGNPNLHLVRTEEVHHELELVLRIAQTEDRWHFSHFTFGLDLTLRGLQNRLKKAGQPWEKAKVFKNSAVIGEWFPVFSIETVLETEFHLTINGELRQSGHGKDMRWQPSELLIDLPTWFPLRPGDLLFTGTPEGVGPLKVGDKLEVHGGPVHYELTCV